MENLKKDGKYVNMEDLQAMSVYGQTPFLKKLTLMYTGARLNVIQMRELQ